MLAPLLYSCQSEDVKHDQAQPETPAYKPITVKATLPSDDIQSRAQITYGNQNEDYEIFMWNEDDEIFLYNISDLENNKDEACFPIGKISGQSAEFSFKPSDCGHATTFSFSKGDTLLALYGETERVKFYGDPRRIVSLVVGMEANKPQYIEKNPTDDNLSYMKDNLKMYDIVVAEDDDVLPDLNFRHLSAILRVTVRNKSGEDVYPTKLEFDYPGTDTFYNTTLYFSVDNTSDGCVLRDYTNKELCDGSEPFTSNVGTTINGKSGTIDAGGSIPNGESYELYLSAVPRLNNDRKGSSLTIDLIESHVTENPFRLTIDGFDAIIKPGLRYWFDVTLLPDRKMVLTRSLSEDSSEDSNE